MLTPERTGQRGLATGLNSLNLQKHCCHYSELIHQFQTSSPRAEIKIHLQRFHSLIWIFTSDGPGPEPEPEADLVLVSPICWVSGSESRVSVSLSLVTGAWVMHNVMRIKWAVSECCHPVSFVSVSGTTPGQLSDSTNKQWVAASVDKNLCVSPLRRQEVGHNFWHTLDSSEIFIIFSSVFLSWHLTHLAGGGPLPPRELGVLLAQVRVAGQWKLGHVTGHVTIRARDTWHVGVHVTLTTGQHRHRVARGQGPQLGLWSWNIY